MAYQVGTVNLEPPHTSLLSEEALALLPTGCMRR